MKRKWLLIIVGSFLMSSTGFAQGQSTSSLYRKNSKPREFVLSSTYGVLAGALIGAATLVFEDKPGENLNHVARGASWGLYAGLLLGAYVTYWAPRQIARGNAPSDDRARDSYDDSEAPDPDRAYDEQEDYRYDDGGYEGEDGYYDEGRLKLQLIPMISERGVDGLGAVVQFSL